MFVRRSAGHLRELAFGWALGHALVIFAFMATAALDVRSLLFAYPFLAAAMLPLVRRHTAATDEAASPEAQATWWPWALAGVCVVALTYVALGYFAQTPLPGASERVTYYPDLPWDLSMAAEARNHWPIGDPQVAGVSMRYYNFVFVELAATSQVTGIDLPVVVFRLYVVPLVLVLVLAGAAAGYALSRKLWVAPLVPAVFLLLGEFDPDPSVRYPFLGVFLGWLYESPTFLLGLTFFFPAVVLIYDRLTAPPESGRGVGEWLLLLIFLVACAGAKGHILPVIAGGLVVFMVLQRVIERRFSREPLLALAATTIVFGAFYAVQLRGRPRELSLDPMSAIERMAAVQTLEARLPAAIADQGWLFWPLAAAFGMLGIAPVVLLGIAWAMWAHRRRLERRHLWAVALLVAGSIPVLLFGHHGAGQLYFFWYGYTAAALLAAEGLYLLSKQWRSLGRRARAAAAIVGCVVLITALNTPLDFAAVFREWRNDRTVYSHVEFGMTPELYAGLVWIRSNAEETDVIAANVTYADDGPEGALKCFYVCGYYGAFAERRVLLGWPFSSTETFVLGILNVFDATAMPYADRAELNDAIFTRGDAAAIATAERDYDVRYLVVDKLHGPEPPPFGAAATLSFANADVAVYEVARPD